MRWSKEEEFKPGQKETKPLATRLGDETHKMWPRSALGLLSGTLSFASSQHPGYRSTGWREELEKQILEKSQKSHFGVAG